MNLNPLDILNKRQVDTLPAHFHTIEIQSEDVSDIKGWVHSKLIGRYCILEMPYIKDGKIQSVNIVAFEIASELTFFTIACPYIFKG